MVTWNGADGITLLSAGEAAALPTEARNTYCCWLQRSPGGYRYYSTGVGIDGSVYIHGRSVSSGMTPTV